MCATTALYFYFISQAEKSPPESFIDHTAINRTSRGLFPAETAIPLRVYAPRRSEIEARPLVIDHRVTVPLPNFKYAHTSQLVTANYLGRLLPLEEAI
jgi:hypothetical protein